MKFSILIPHYRTPKITAYSVYQFLQNKGKHEVDIIVINNSYPDNSIDSLKVFGDKIKIVNHISDKISSHGVALDSVVPMIDTEYFITAESDSFPTNPEWLDYYERLINEGYDAAGSLLLLSGGYYLHPAGAMYRKSVWQQCKNYCDKIEYSYFPNMAKKEGFDCHLMVHNRILESFVGSPEKFIELAENYKPYSIEKAYERREYYSSVVCPFHNGMGNLQESVKTYGDRSIQKDTAASLMDGKEDFIYRIGYEPGQYFCYWMLAVGKKIFGIPTHTFWMPNRVNQQQERTINQCGFTHIWGGSAWKNCDKPDVQDIVKRKEFVENELWGSLPEEIKNPA